MFLVCSYLKLGLARQLIYPLLNIRFPLHPTASHSNILITRSVEVLTLQSLCVVLSWWLLGMGESNNENNVHFFLSYVFLHCPSNFGQANFMAMIKEELSFGH